MRFFWCLQYRLYPMLLLIIKRFYLFLMLFYLILTCYVKVYAYLCKNVRLPVSTIISDGSQEGIIN